MAKLLSCISAQAAKHIAKGGDIALTQAAARRRRHAPLPIWHSAPAAL